MGKRGRRIVQKVQGGQQHKHFYAKKEGRRALAREIAASGKFTSAHQNFVNASARSFAYTVGLTAFRLPEIVITGIRHPSTTATLLRALGEHSLKVPFRAGDEVPLPEMVRVFDEAAYRMMAVAEGGDYAFPALRQLYGKEYRLLQAVWPDDIGSYPGTAQWDEHSASTGQSPHRQPLLKADDRPLPQGLSRWEPEPGP